MNCCWTFCIYICYKRIRYCSSKLRGHIILYAICTYVLKSSLKETIKINIVQCSYSIATLIKYLKPFCTNNINIQEVEHSYSKIVSRYVNSLMMLDIVPIENHITNIHKTRCSVTNTIGYTHCIIINIVIVPFIALE